MKKILVTGGCGYKGHVLVPKLLARGYAVDVIDTMWFGNFLEEHPNLTTHKLSVLKPATVPMSGVDIVIHLSSIANDPCGDLNPALTWETSALATMQIADKAARNGVTQFIYASSGSVYGVKDEDQVTEDLELDPISEYNKTKMVSERVLLSYADNMTVQIIRPATVCGLSPRMRLDVSVNLLTMAALEKGKITVFGGDQVRPNVHIEDITDAYIHFIDHPEFTGTYNVGFENLSIMEIAEMVSEMTEAPVEVTESSDPRSYRVNSDKILATGFAPKKTVRDAISEIIAAYQSGKLRNEPHFHNLTWMQRNNLAL
ncbi:MAG: SDR family oxidoreductase [Rhodospirillales bacterium]